MNTNKTSSFHSSPPQGMLKSVKIKEAALRSFKWWALANIMGLIVSSKKLLLSKRPTADDKISQFKAVCDVMTAGYLAGFLPISRVISIPSICMQMSATSSCTCCVCCSILPDIRPRVVVHRSKLVWVCEYANKVAVSPSIRANGPYLACSVVQLIVSACGQNEMETDCLKNNTECVKVYLVFV